KNWGDHPDKILSTLCRYLTGRKLFKVKLQATPFADEFFHEKQKEAGEKLGITMEESDYFVFMGETSNTAYDLKDERICILFKDGSIKDISQVDNALIHQHV